MSPVERIPNRNWWESARSWIRSGTVRKPGGIGLAFGGGFARGIAHVGVLRALEKHNIPICAVSGVSSGAIVAAAIASGATSYDIEKVALAMKFRDVARWTLNIMGLAGNERMIPFLARLLKAGRFEDMQIRLAIVATDLITGKAVTFHGTGDVVLPIRASCAYPGFFSPIRYQGKLLVDGFVSMEVPAEPLLQMGADRVISINIPNHDGLQDYGNMLSVVSRCFQVMSTRCESSWRRYSKLVITPPVADMTWDSFASAKKLIACGEQAAMAAIPTILKWLPAQEVVTASSKDAIPVTVSPATDLRSTS
jgi:NTE family protein